MPFRNGRHDFFPRGWPSFGRKTHAVDVSQPTKSASQPNAVQAVQHPDDFFRVTLYKTKHGVAPGGEGFVEKTTLPPGAR
ncbi:MAG TPA: hypothetical protein VFI31_06335, partial [Pirellulales bacterium]|nr:hypothetical protein [Pirellulales bacterium]